ncbi:MAG: ABC transporter ATP-binding protein [Candidatus Krumholzibacteriia bacterium]
MNAAANDTIIRMREIRRDFPVGSTTVHALAGVELEVRRGELVAIMGPSGSGKSTLLNVLGCLDQPTGGSYELDGEQVARLSPDRLADIRQHKIGFVFQSFHLLGRMTALRNVELPMVFAGVPRAERQRRADEALRSVGLAHRLQHRPHQLSGGERQRVAIARAVVMRPSIVLADEPTGNLDSEAGRSIMRLLHEMNDGGLTVLVVTHNADVAREAGRILRMQDGRFVNGVGHDGT